MSDTVQEHWAYHQNHKAYSTYRVICRDGSAYKYDLYEPLEVKEFVELFSLKQQQKISKVEPIQESFLHRLLNVEPKPEEEEYNAFMVTFRNKSMKKMYTDSKMSVHDFLKTLGDKIARVSHVQPVH